MEKICKNCKYWELGDNYDRDGGEFGDIPGAKTFGECRRYAPRPTFITEEELPGRKLNIPYTDDIFWCGDFVQRDKS